MIEVPEKLTESAANVRELLVPKWVAVNLDPLGAQSLTDDFLERGTPTCSLLPPAALLPRLPGEPTRADVALPPHIRGTGFPWPPEAQVSALDGSGRYPIGYAWEHLSSGKGWRWSGQQAEAELGPAEALAAAVAAVLLQHTREPRIRPQTILVIPNDLPEAAQQRLLDECRALGMEVKLLWRPVAAGLVWLQRFEQELRVHERHKLQVTGPSEVNLGQLLVVHMGAEAAEATPLSVIARREGTRWRFLTGRLRPNPACSAHGAGQRTLERLVAQLIGGNHHDIRGRWQTHWASGRLNETLAALRTEADPRARPHSDWIRVCSRSAADVPNLLSEIGGHASRGSSGRNSMQVFEEARRLIGTRPLLGVIFTGPLAGTYLNDKTLAQHHLDGVGLRSDRVLVEGGNLPLGALALGAGYFARLLQTDQPAYLDTLPEIQLAVAVRGEPTWKSLLLEDQRWVDGGKVWRRDPNFPNLVVREGSETLDLNLVHQEFSTVRKVESVIPVVLEKDAPISLAVSMEPAQGSARVEVVPDQAGLFGKKRVWVEWRRMSDTGQDPKTYLEQNYPRIFPPQSPRHASANSWRRVSSSAKSLWREWNATGQAPNVIALRKLGDRLSQRDQSYFHPATGVREAAAIGSDGAPPIQGEGWQALQAITDRLLSQLLSSRPHDKGVSELVRALGYTATVDPRFEDYLDRRIRAADTGLDRYELEAIGWCLRDPKRIAVFAGSVLARLQAGPGTNVWVKALTAVLRFRPEATRDVSSVRCTQLCSELIRVFTTERLTGKGNFSFRNACLSVVYLLRRRQYDDDFLDPESSLALHIKGEFRAAVADERARRLRLIGGMFDLSREMQRLIDYIDRHGHGLPGMA